MTVALAPGYDADADARDHFELIDKEAKGAAAVFPPPPGFFLISYCGVMP